ncbi:hypothetical protein ElyMa_006265700 [Elysia marginata]|uniref:Uncharacterized protein n=1 Tax=Elysia marginata TaxID=1093978 RepID=A0AAV4HDF0_9GAST|nr:hypothetical protein ElyMa_006265700 [Elysia marginata]
MCTIWRGINQRNQNLNFPAGNEPSADLETGGQPTPVASSRPLRGGLSGNLPTSALAQLSLYGKLNISSEQTKARTASNYFSVRAKAKHYPFDICASL